jgi:large subunit ribosomal protein L11
MKATEYSVNIEKKRGSYESDFNRSVKLLVPSQNATLSPPLGPTLGQFGVNIKDFCDKFNDRSKIFEADIVLNVLVTLFRNKTFDFQIKFPSTAFMINEEEVELENEYIPKYLTLSSIYKIILIKEKNIALKRQSLLNCILGTARSMDTKLINDISRSSFKK